MELEEQDKEILKNIKEYMQGSIDRGCHKFIYNDLDWDFKCIDAINAIETVLKELEKKDKIINEMIKVMSDRKICKYYIEDYCVHYAGENKKLCDVCLKQYFEKKAEESE